MRMSLADVLFGRPLASSDGGQQRIGWLEGIATLGLGALGSAAYGPEAALTVLLALGAAGPHYLPPLTGVICGLLALVAFSYRQSIAVYPGGGGSYTAAQLNLGTHMGLVAAAALMIDYVLNVAVGISAGVGAVVSAAPALQPYTLTLSLGILALLTLVNLRGARDSGLLFMAPAYLYVACLAGVIAWGVYETLATGGHPRAVVAPARPPAAHAAAGVWLLLAAFASGCTAITGVEAVSNGVQAFREPVVPKARRTQAFIALILAALLAGIAWLCSAYEIVATTPGRTGYRSVLTQLTAAVSGSGVFYYLTTLSILLVLCLSANSSFASFPLLCRAAAADGYLPGSFTNCGRRLVYTEGIWVLAALSAALLLVFGGITDRLIPLFAAAAFLAFTVSQASMAVRWRKAGGRAAAASMVANAVGATGTGVVLVAVLVSRFVEGAWVVAVLVAGIVVLMKMVRRHYRWISRQTVPQPAFLADLPRPPLAIVPVDQWDSASQKALRFALTISAEVQAIHVECPGTSAFTAAWTTEVEQAAAAVGLPVPALIVLRSPYRSVIQPIIDHVLAIERDHPERTIAVIIPQLVKRRWYHYFLHNQRGALLAALLLVKGDRRITIVNVPWYLPPA